MYTNMRFPKIIPVSFKDLFPNRLLLGFLNIYIIPIGNNTMGKNIKYRVNMNDIIANTNEIIEATQITN